MARQTKTPEPRAAAVNGAARPAKNSASHSPRRLRHIRAAADLTAAETLRILDLALELKQERLAGVDQRRLPGKVLGLLFEKPSLRTRVSFEAAMAHLGGACVFLTGKEVGLGERESVSDFAKVVSGYVDVVAARTFSHDRVEELAQYARIPIINALSDLEHPCQALGDLSLLKQEFGDVAGLRLAFVGDANNVSRSLAVACIHAGVDFVLSGPKGYEFPPVFLEELKLIEGPGSFRFETDPNLAVADADVVYTDVWTSMGQEAEADERRRIFAPYQVDEKLFAKAKPTARFLHCLPVRRGEEVTTEVIDGPASRVFEQAEFRLHAQKALLLWLFTEAE